MWRHDLLDYNTVKGNEAILDGYWILSLMPSWFLGHLTKLFQVANLNSVDHPVKFFIMNLYNNVTKECNEVYSNYFAHTMNSYMFRPTM